MALALDALATWSARHVRVRVELREDGVVLDPVHVHELLRADEGRRAAVPQGHDLDLGHVAGVVADDVDEAELRLDRLDLVRVERIAAAGRRVLHRPAGVPAPAVAPEVQGVSVGRVVRLRPGHELRERLGAAHVALAPVGDRARRIGDHALGRVVQLGGLPVAAALVVARAAVGERRDLDVGRGAECRKLQLEVLDDVGLEVVVARHVDHHGPLGLCGRRGGTGGGDRSGDHRQDGRDECQTRDARVSGHVVLPRVTGVGSAKVALRTMVLTRPPAAWIADANGATAPRCADRTIGQVWTARTTRHTCGTPHP